MCTSLALAAIVKVAGALHALGLFGGGSAEQASMAGNAISQFAFLRVPGRWGCLGWQQSHD